MAGVVREGDINIFGGVCVGGVSSVKVNGRNIAVPGMKVLTHPPCSPFLPQHCLSATSKGGLGAGLLSLAGSYFGASLGLPGIGGGVGEFGPVPQIISGEALSKAVGSAAGSAAGSLLGGGGGGGVVLAAGKPIIVKGDHDKCICPRSSCSSDVQIG